MTCCSDLSRLHARGDRHASRVALENPGSHISRSHPSYGRGGLWIVAGCEGTHGWVDPENGFVGVVMTQIGKASPEANDRHDVFREAVYDQLLEERQITDSGGADDGKVMDWSDEVREAQRRYADNDPDDDAWHYDSDGYIRMGIAFADAVADVETHCPP